MALDCTAVGEFHRWSLIPRSRRGSSWSSANDAAIAFAFAFAFDGTGGLIGALSDASLALRFGDCGDSGSGTSCSLSLRFIAMVRYMTGAVGEVVGICSCSGSATRACIYELFWRLGSFWISVLHSEEHVTVPSAIFSSNMSKFHQ
jgi:hypothetical protein